MSIQKGKALLIQCSDSHHQNLLDFAAPLHTVYARKWGWDYWCIRGNMMPSAVHPFWNKAALVMTAVGFGTYNLIVWMDADCLIVDHNVDLRDSPTNYCFLGVSYVADAMGHERYVLAGCYYIKPHHPLAESFLQKIWSRRNEWNDEWVFNRTLEENAIYSNATS